MSEDNDARGKQSNEELLAQIKELEKIAEDQKKRHEVELAEAMKSVEIEESKMNELKERYEQQQADMNSKSSSMCKDANMDQIKKKAEESDKIVQFLQKENNRLRKETSQTEEDLTKMKETNYRLIEANASAGSSLETLNKQAKVLKDHNTKLENSIEEFKNANAKLDRDLRGRKAYYEAETQIRSDYENAMEKIVRLMEEKSDDTELVEKVMTAQLRCVTNMSGDAADGDADADD